MIDMRQNADMGSIACPRCGSRESRSIAPTLVECTATLTDRIQIGSRPVFGPHPMIAGQHVLLGAEPIWEDRHYPCATRHHVGMPDVEWPECSCGTFAIGHCKKCARPVCGDDSVRTFNGLRLCSDCTRSSEVASGGVPADRATDYSAPWPHPCRGGHQPSYAPNGRCWICYPKYSTPVK